MYLFCISYRLLSAFSDFYFNSRRAHASIIFLTQNRTTMFAALKPHYCWRNCISYIQGLFARRDLHHNGTAVKPEALSKRFLFRFVTSICPDKLAATRFVTCLLYWLIKRGSEVGSWNQKKMIEKIERYMACCSGLAPISFVCYSVHWMH